MLSNTTMKRKNKLFLCFRSLPIEPDHRHPISAFSKVSKTSAIESPVTDIGIPSSKSRLHLQKSDSCRSISRVLKSILFEASPKERVHDKTVEEPMLRSNSDGSRKTRKFSKKSVDGLVKSNSFDADKKLTRTNSTISSLSSNSISKLKNYQSLPTQTSLSTSESFNHKKQSNYSRSNSVKSRDSSSSYSGLYLILITLCITILCGRVYAILLMSLWVYCTPRRQDLVGRRSGSTAELLETVECEKRLVIMEGLIERNHHRREGINVLRENGFSRV
ncbi:hypothetical protein LguiA_022633 [Lonicera macranthoides]